MRFFRAANWLLIVLIAVTAPNAADDSTIRPETLRRINDSWHNGPGGDINGDGLTDYLDLLLLAESWQQPAPYPHYAAQLYSTPPSQATRGDLITLTVDLESPQTLERVLVDLFYDTETFDFVSAYLSSPMLQAFSDSEFRGIALHMIDGPNGEQRIRLACLFGELPGDETRKSLATIRLRVKSDAPYGTSSLNFDATTTDLQTDTQDLLVTAHTSRITIN